MSREIKGIVVPLVTPFQQDESLSESALRTIVSYLIEAGVHGLFPCGSQGEFFALTDDEKRRVMDIVIDEARGRVFVMPNTGAITTRESVALSRYAAKAGADAISVVTPFYIKPSSDELRQHYARIAEAVSIPILAYNIPERTGVSLAPSLMASLARAFPNFVGVKDSSGDLTNTLGYIEQCPSGFRTFMGRDTMIYAALCYGCVGAVAATANVAPELAVGIYDAFRAGDHATALEKQRALSPLRRAFALGSFPVVVKDALTLMGLPAGPARTPITSLTGTPREELVAILRALGKLAP